MNLNDQIKKFSFSSNKGNCFLAVLTLILIAATYRLDFLNALNYRIDSDEAIVGLMAKHMNEGESFPAFYYGQHYMGSFEALIVSYFFKIFGMGAKALKLVPFIFSILLIPIIYLIGKEIQNSRVGIIAAAYIAICPPTLVVWSSMARGGFIETLVLSALALLIFIRWLKEEQLSLLRIFIVGLICGFGWWTNNQIIYVMSALGWFALGRVLNSDRKIYNLISHLIVGLSAFIIGSFPFWIYNFNNNFASFGLFHFTDNFFEQFGNVFSIALPILLGAKKFWEIDDLFYGSTLVILIIYSFILVSYIVIRRKELLNALIFKVTKESAPEILFFMLLFSIIIFSASSFGYLSQAPRYLLPFYVPLSLLVAYILGNVFNFNIFSKLIIISMLALNLSFSYVKGRLLPGPPFVYGNERVASGHSEIIEKLKNLNIWWVRTNYWIGYRLAFETNEEVKFLMLGKPDQVRMQSYPEEFDKTNIDIDEVPILTVAEEAKVLSVALNRLGYHFLRSRVGSYILIYNIKRKYKLGIEILPKEYELSSSHKNENLEFISDKKRATRWGSGKAQSPDMYVEASFENATTTSGIHYELGRFTHDYPREFQIEIIDENKRVKEVLSSKEYNALRYYFSDTGTLILRWKPIKTKKIVFKQSGSDPVFDWSIAELKIIK